MSRALSGTGLASALANETAEEWIALLTISHASFATHRLARRKTSITSNGQSFSPSFFDLVLPSQIPNELPRWQITIDIVDQVLLGSLRSVDTPPNIQIDIIRASSPNTIDMTTGSDYKLRGVRYTGTTLTAEISMEDLIGEGFPGGRILPSNFPGGF